MVVESDPSQANRIEKYLQLNNLTDLARRRSALWEYEERRDGRGVGIRLLAQWENFWENINISLKYCPIICRERWWQRSFPCSVSWNISATANEATCQPGSITSEEEDGERGRCSQGWFLFGDENFKMPNGAAAFITLNDKRHLKEATLRVRSSELDTRSWHCPSLKSQN